MDGKLRTAIDDSYYLLAFCSRAKVEPSPGNLKLFDDAVAAITAIQVKLEDNIKLTADDVSIFWRSFIIVSNVCFPATVESIRTYFAYNQNGKLPGPRFELIAFMVLIVTISFSLLWFIGRTALDQYMEDYSQYSMVAQLSRFHDEGQSLRVTFDPTAKVYRIVLPNSDVQVSEVVQDRIGPIIQLFPDILERLDQETIKTVGVEPKNDPKARPTKHAGLLVSGSSTPPDHILDKFGVAVDPINESLNMTFLCDTNKNTAAWKVFCGCPNLVLKRRDILVADQLVAYYSNLDTDRRALMLLTGPFELLHKVLWYLGLIPSEALFQDGSAPPSLRAGDVTATPCRDNVVASTSSATTAPDATSLPPPSETERSASSPHPERGPGEPSSVGLSSAKLGPGLREALLIYAGLLKMGRPVPVLLPPPLESLASVQLKAHLALSVLSKYVLTLLFGTLGACVAVLREINARLENFTLVPSAMRRYYARIVLGAVAGPFLALCFDQSGQLFTIGVGSANPGPALWSQLSPLAWAFLAGFSVEILFSILDRFIKVFREFASGGSQGPERR